MLQGAYHYTLLITRDMRQEYLQTFLQFLRCIIKTTAYPTIKCHFQPSPEMRPARVGDASGEG